MVKRPACQGVPAAQPTIPPSQPAHPPPAGAIGHRRPRRARQNRRTRKRTSISATPFRSTAGSRPTPLYRRQSRRFAAAAGGTPPARTRLRGWYLASQGGTPQQPKVPSNPQPVTAYPFSRNGSSSSQNPPRIAPSSMRPPMDHKCALLSLLTPPPGTPTCTLYLPLGTPSGEIPPPSP